MTKMMRSLGLLLGASAGLCILIPVAEAFTPVHWAPRSASASSIGGATTHTRRTSWAASSSLHASTPQEQAQGGVVITGGAGGVGYAYAGEFLDRGYNVVICDVKDCTAAANALNAKHGSSSAKVYATQCDVSDAASVERLGQFAKEQLGTVQYWINNAGINGGRRDLRDVPTSQVEAVVKVNLLGILLCTKVAMSIMEQQVGVTGHIFNTVGSGVKGGGTPGYACYGATKRGLPQLTATLGT